MTSYFPDLSSSVKSRISLSSQGEETLGLPRGKARSRESRLPETSSSGGGFLPTLILSSNSDPGR